MKPLRQKRPVTRTRGCEERGRLSSQRGGGHAKRSYGCGFIVACTCARAGCAAPVTELASREGTPGAPLQHLQPPLACSSPNPSGRAGFRAHGPRMPASTTHARISLPSSVCISAAMRQHAQCNSAATVRSRAHLLNCPLSLSRKRADMAQGQCGRGIGLRRAQGGFQASASLRAEAQASARRP